MRRLAKGIFKVKVVLSLIVGVLLYTVFNADVRERYIVNKVKDKIIYVLDPVSLRSGGTGFFVKAASGATVIITNEHVCALGKDGAVALKVGDEENRFFMAKIIERSKTTDLCAVENPFSNDGLSLANGVSQWEKVFVVGHPSLENLTLTEGQVTSFEFISLVVAMNIDQAACNSRGGSILTEEDALFGKANLCIKTVFSARTTANVFPGNSGSPVVNKYGNVVGVLFAGNNNSHFGYFVPVSDLRKFLGAY